MNQEKGHQAGQQVAVLFVSSDSIYKTIDGCDCYDATRNALSYEGSLPVVAHPPCQLWGALASVNYARWGGEHNKPGNDGGMFSFALSTVRRVGGVIEHPAKTKAWAKYGLAKPRGAGWQKTIDGGWVCEVWQSAYGHRANKATWLYCFGEPKPAIWKRVSGTHQVGFYDQRGKSRNKPTLCKKEANHTPIEFAKYLIDIAINSKKHPTIPASETGEG